MAASPYSTGTMPLTSATGDEEADLHRKRLEEALLLQMAMQKKLHEQLEAQRKLQVTLEQHGRYISSLLENNHIAPPTSGFGLTSHMAEDEAGGNGHAMHAVDILNVHHDLSGSMYNNQQQSYHHNNNNYRHQHDQQNYILNDKSRMQHHDAVFVEILQDQALTHNDGTATATNATMHDEQQYYHHQQYPGHYNSHFSDQQ